MLPGSDLRLFSAQALCFVSHCCGLLLSLCGREYVGRKLQGCQVAAYIRRFESLPACCSVFIFMPVALVTFSTGDSHNQRAYTRLIGAEFH